jgi:polysaccharide deacetylase family protein (PEP-CTERM system associated)
VVPFLGLFSSFQQPKGARLTLPHRFSVDVEEHFHVSAFEPFIARADWGRQPSRVDATIDILLELLARHRTRGTFFVVGWLADRNPALVHRISAAGHEIASHSWWHRRVPTLTPAEFREDVKRTKARLEEISGRPVHGFRAPSFSILPGMEWAFDTLLETGHTYDSSVFPIRRPGYGWPGAPTAPYDIVRPGGTLREYPMTTLDVWGFRIPAAGGGYLRQFPYSVIHGAFKQRESRGEEGMFYVHPWELDAGQPRIPCGFLTRVRHYRGLDRTLPRLDRLLTDLRFTSIQDCASV